MKKNLTLLAIISWALIIAQLPVSHNPENRNVVLEEFTAVDCGSCPNAHRMAAIMQRRNPNDFFVISYQSVRSPDYSTQFNAAIENLANVTSIPVGMINRHAVGGVLALNVSQWNNATQSILSQSSYLNVALQSSIDVNNREMTVDVEVYYTGDSPLSTNYLNVAIVQNNIAGPQLNSDLNAAAILPNGDYNHMHILRHLVTGQWGDVINNTTQGSLVQKHYTFTLPTDIHNIPLVFGDLEIIAFVAESHQDIITGNKGVIIYQNLPYNNNIELSEIVLNDGICDSKLLKPKVKILNKGSNILTSMSINCTINGTVMPIYNWTGAVYPLEDAIIELPQYNFNLSNNNSIEVNINNINSSSDEDTTDNSKTKNFTKSTYNSIGTNYTLTINQNENGSDITWEILDSNDNVLVSGGPYPYVSYSEMREEHITLPDYDCYQFVIYDAAGDGMGQIGWYSFGVDGASSNLFYADGDSYDFKDVKFFTSAPTANIEELNDNSIKLFPNPVKETLHITADEKIDKIGIYNFSGQLLLENEPKQNHFAVSLNRWSSGIYLLKIVSKNNIESFKFIKK